MTTTVRKFAVGVATAALVAGVAAPAMAADYTDNRLAGATRYETAIAVAENGFTTAATVYVANGEDAHLVDAIAAGALPGGPLLLVNDDAGVQAKVKTALTKLGTSSVVVIGGTSAVSDDTVKAILPSGASSSRISGDDRYATAVAIAKKAAGITSTKPVASETVKVYLANGKTLVDALVGGQLTDGVILLTEGADKIPAATAQAINKSFYNSTIVALGGVNAITDAALNEANVARVILTNSYLEDFAAEIKASAVADEAYYGYYTVSPLASQSTVLNAIEAAGDQNGFSGKVNRAKAESTWPKIPANLAPAGSYYIATKADGTIDTSATAAAAKTAVTAYKATTFDDGTAAPHYMGTAAAALAAAGVYSAADAAKTAVTGANTAITTSATGIFAGDTPDTTIDTNTTKVGTSVPAWSTVGGLDFGKLEDIFATGLVPANTTVNQYFTKIGVPLPANEKNYVTADDGTNGATPMRAYTALKNAMTSKVSALQAASNAAATADETAAKTASTAKTTLLARMTSRVPSIKLNRIAGATRFETAVEIAKAEFGDKGADATSYLYFANGRAFADAAVAGLIDNGSKRGPVLLVEKTSVPSSTAAHAVVLDKAKDYLRSNIFAIGGPAVISDDSFGKELDALAPTTAATGYVNFGSFLETSTKLEIPVNYKDLPNGTTIRVTWEAQTSTGWAAAGTVLHTGAVVNNNIDANGKTSLTTLTNADNNKVVRVKVEVVQPNGEPVSTVYSANYKIEAQ